MLLPLLQLILFFSLAHNLINTFRGNTELRIQVAILLIALIKAAVLRLGIRESDFHTSRIWLYAIAIDSSRPELTKSISSAPRATPFLSASDSRRPVLSSTTRNSFSKLVCSNRLPILPNRTWDRFFSHSKYETVTPPAFK